MHLILDIFGILFGLFVVLMVWNPGETRFLACLIMAVFFGIGQYYYFALICLIACAAGIMKEDAPLMFLGVGAVLLVIVFQIGLDFLECFLGFAWSALTNLTHPYKILGYFLLYCSQFLVSVVDSVGSNILSLWYIAHTWADTHSLSNINVKVSLEASSFSKMIGEVNCFLKMYFYHKYGIEWGLFEELTCISQFDQSN